MKDLNWDEVGYPAAATRVGPDVGELPEWRVKFNQQRRERRRQQCREAHRRWLEKVKELENG